jgi:hypothetical protein
MTNKAGTVGVALRFAADRPQRAHLREPLGADELAVAGVDTRSAVDLLDRLLEASPCSAAELCSSDRDALLAGLHRLLWGDRIECSLSCPACQSLYDLSFELSALEHHLHKQGKPAQAIAPRRIADPQEGPLNLPSAAEEEGAADRGLEVGVALLAAGIAGREDVDPVELSARLESLAPILDVDLDAPCAECGRPQQVRFDIQSFVLQRLLDERELVLNDVHALARGYGWSLSEIVSLKRSLRRSLVERLTVPSAGSG